MKIAVGSTNPAKVDAVRNVFERVYGKENVDVVYVKVESGVPAQPFDDETVEGAIMRAEGAYFNTVCDIGVGIEGGIFNVYGRMFNVQYCALYDEERTSIGCGSGFETPAIAADEVRKGVEFGKVMDKLTGKKDIGRKEGGIGYMTDGKLTRTQLTEQCVFSALIPRMKPELYKRRRS
jgi:inosine/xanthosine triphosphatase